MLLSGFPIIFTQKRVGKNGRVFTIFKFRTMHPGAHAKQRQLRGKNISDGPVFKIHDDPRFTHIGKFLSHTGLDELPQLYNVIRGEMALIGPRPLPVNEAKQLKPWMHAREHVLPGIISPAILSGKYHENFDAWMKSDVAYISSKHFIHDLSLCLQAIGFLLRLACREVITACIHPDYQDIVRETNAKKA